MYRECATSVITTSLQIGGYKPINFSIPQSPHRQRSAAGQIRPRSVAASDPHHSLASSILLTQLYIALNAVIALLCGRPIGRIMRLARPSVCLSVCRPIRARNLKTEKRTKNNIS